MLDLDQAQLIMLTIQKNGMEVHGQKLQILIQVEQKFQVVVLLKQQVFVLVEKYLTPDNQSLKLMMEVLGLKLQI